MNKTIEDLLNFCSSRGFTNTTVFEFEYSKEAFGNAQIIIKVNKVKMKIVLDRGQTFIDIWGEDTKSFSNAESSFPELKQLQEKGTWSLFDQLSLIFR